MRNIRFLAALVLLLSGCSFPDSTQGDSPGGSDDSDQGDGPETQPAPVDVDLNSGDMVEAQLEHGGSDLWTFSGEAGDVVTLSMLSADFDSFLALFGPSGNYLICDDDGGDDFNATIADFLLADAGVYTLVAMEWMPDQGGTYTLSIISGGEGSMISPAEPGSLSIGDMESGSLAGRSAEAWIFRGSMGDVVSIGARSADFDTMLDLYGPDLHRVAWDNDSLGDDDSFISGLALTDTGGYTAVVRGLLGETEGVYEIGIAMGTEIPGWEAFSPATESNLSYGDTISGDLMSATGEQWVFSASAGDSVDISLTSNDFDPFLALFSPEGEYLTCDDDGGVDLGAKISGYTLSVSGLYTLDVLSYLPDSFGAYTLVLTQTTPGETPSSISTAEIVFGESIEQQLGTWVGDVWLFNGTAGDRVTISMTSETFETALELYTPEHLMVARADGGNSDTDSLISQARLPVTGVYSIVARGFGPGQIGDYTITLTKES
ncbi:MAG TPA: hypothetical protein G4O08_09420 [Anaerolineae bacterium]|nr:hypothetical protein [Anaerolineae bacterium]